MQIQTRKQYSADFKAKVVKEMLREEKTVGQLAAEYGVHSNMLYRTYPLGVWYIEGMSQPLGPDELWALICLQVLNRPSSW